MIQQGGGTSTHRARCRLVHGRPSSRLNPPGSGERGSAPCSQPPASSIAVATGEVGGRWAPAGRAYPEQHDSVRPARSKRSGAPGGGHLPEALTAAALSSVATNCPPNVREELVRIDHQFSDKFWVFGHYVHEAISQNLLAHHVERRQRSHSGQYVRQSVLHRRHSRHLRDQPDVC